MAHRKLRPGRALGAAAILSVLASLPPLGAQGLLDGVDGGGASAAKGRASWKVSVEPRELKRGEKAEIVAEYTVEPGWWIYAPDHDAVPGQATVISVESPSVELAGKPAFPPPEVKRVEVLDETHRILKKTGVIRQPFVVKKDAPPGDLAIKVAAHFVACNEEMCDLPKKPSFDVTVKVLDTPSADAAPEKGAAPKARPEGRAAWKVTVEPREVRRGEKAEIVAEYTVEPGWWIYAPDHDAVPGQATEIRVESPGIEPAGKPTFPAPEVKRVPELNETHRILKKTGVIRQPFTVKKDAPVGDLAIKVTTAYVACDETMCDLQKKPSFDVAVKVSNAPAVAGAAAVPEQLPGPAPPAAAADDPIASASLLAFILLMVGGGLITLVMPCTYPMIPITISYFTKQADARNGAVTGLALAYGAGIILIFNVIGWAFAGTIYFIATNEWVNLIFGLAFLVFALALFGILELRLPSSFSTATTRASGAGGYFGVFLLGAVLVVTSFTCTAPILGSLLLLAGKEGNVGRVTLGMTAFGVTVATPFVLLSLFPAKVRNLPRAGEWMHVVKVSLGFLELAAALKFFSNFELKKSLGVLPRELFLVLWAAIFLVMGLYLLSVFRMKDEESRGVGGIRMLFGLGAILAAFYFFYGSLGYKLDRISETMAPPYSAPRLGAAQGSSGENKLAWTIVEDDLEAGLARARAEGKRALINFTGKL
jgi:thiol:disulfide interchange protein DsbD